MSHSSARKWANRIAATTLASGCLVGFGGSVPSDATTCTITGSGTIYGTAGNDVICGSDSADYILAGGGNDVVLSAGGSDTVYGGSGGDTLDGGAGNDILIGSDWWGPDGNDTITGGPGNDQMSGAAGNDTIFAADGEADVCCATAPNGGSILGGAHGGVGTDSAQLDAVDAFTSIEVFLP